MRQVRRSRTSWLAISLAWVTGVALVAAAGVTVMVADDQTGLWPLLLLGFPVVGGLLSARQHENRLGMLLVLVGFWLALALTADVYTVLAHTRLTLPAADLVAWVSGWVFIPFSLIVFLLIASFPTGEPISPWLRWPLRLLVGLVSMGVLLRMLLPVPVASGIVEGLVNPWAVDGLEFLLPVDAIAGNVGPFLLVLVFVDLVIRWRRSTGVRRLQMRSLGLVMLWALLAFTATFIVRLMGAGDVIIEWVDTVAWLSILASVPLAVWVAVTRHRLYEVDRLISRTVSYAIIVGLLAGAVAVVAALVGTRFEEPGVVAATTLGVAAAFNPVRRRVQSLVDGRFNRSRYDAERVVDEFTGTLRDRVDPEGVVDGWVGVVSETMQPTAVGVWVRQLRR